MKKSSYSYTKSYSERNLLAKFLMVACTRQLVRPVKNCIKVAIGRKLSIVAEFDPVGRRADDGLEDFMHVSEPLNSIGEGLLVDLGVLGADAVVDGAMQALSCVFIEREPKAARRALTA